MVSTALPLAGSSIRWAVRSMMMFVILMALAASDVMAQPETAPTADPEGELRRLDEITREGAEKLEENEDAEDVRGREEWFLFQRRFPYDHIPNGLRENAIAKAELMDRTVKMAAMLQKGGAGLLAANAWEPIGPLNVGGRVLTVAPHPTNGQIIYAGAAAGGVWKTTNGGTTWTPLFDKMTAMTMGALAIDKNHPDTVYAGTGEIRPADLVNYFSDGIFRTTNGGATWTNVGLTNVGAFTKLFVHRQNSNIIYATAGREAGGFYRSSDFGQTWKLVMSGNIYDLTVSESNSDTLYIATSSTVYRSVDAGQSFQSASSGIVATRAKRISVAIAPSSPNRLYALSARASTNQGGNDSAQVYSSSDHGATWQLRRTFSGSFFAFQGDYNNCLEVHPTNPNIVVAGGIDIYRTTDGGSTWSNTTNFYSHYDFTLSHADNHELVFLPSNPSTVLNGSDGGVYISTNSGGSWRRLANQIAITQFYGFDVDQTRPYRVYGGTQDNGTWGTIGTSSFNQTWSNYLLGDGFEVVVDKVDPNFMYGEQPYGALSRINIGTRSSTRIDGGVGSDAGLFSTPIEMSAADNRLYSGRTYLWRAQNPRTSPVAWTRLTPGNTSKITSIGLSPHDGKKLMVGTSGGELLFSTNDGSSWATSKGVPSRTITDIMYDPSNARRVYVTVSGFSAAHVYRSDDDGENFVSISANLPDIPVNAIEIDPANTNHIFIATDAGTYLTLDGGTLWLPFNEGMPYTPVLDLKIQRSTRTLVAGTYGRSMFRISIDNPQPEPAVVRPLSAETFRAPGDVPIQWYGFTGAVKVSITYDDNVYQEIAPNVAGGTHTFTAPLVRTSRARIKVEEIGTGRVAYSGLFSLVPQANGLRIGNRGFIAEAIATRGDQLWASVRNSDTISRMRMPVLSNRQSIRRSGFTGAIKDMSWSDQHNVFFVLVSDEGGANARVWRMDTTGAAQGEVDLSKSTTTISGIAATDAGLALMTPGATGRLYVIDPATGDVISQSQSLTGATDNDRRGLVYTDVSFVQGVNGGSLGLDFPSLLERFEPTDPPVVVEKTPVVISTGDRLVFFDIALDNRATSIAERIYFATDTAGTFYRFTYGEVFTGGTTVGVSSPAMRPAMVAITAITPNPTRAEAVATYQLKRDEQVTIELFTPEGRNVAMIDAGRQEAGEHTVTLDASGLSSGIYYIALSTASGERVIKSMVVVR